MVDQFRMFVVQRVQRKETIIPKEYQKKEAGQALAKITCKGQTIQTSREPTSKWMTFHLPGITSNY